MHDLSREKHWIVLYLLITFGLDSVASGVGPTEVVLWEDPGYSGPSFNYSINTNRGDATQDIYAVFALNDKISSVEVGSDVKVAFYRHNFFCGPSKVFEGSVPYLGNYWNDQMSSLIIELRHAQLHPLIFMRWQLVIILVIILQACKKKWMFIQIHLQQSSPRE